jgi:hypothetical protein
MKYSDFKVWEDDLIRIYHRCGTKPFIHSEISDITHRGTMNRYAEREYFVRVKGTDGRPLKKGVRGRANVWRFHNHVAEMCRAKITKREWMDAGFGWNRDLPEILWKE